MNPGRHQFGRDQMLEVIRHHATKSAAQIVESLYCAARDFAQGAPQKDDIAAIVVKVLEA